MKDQTDVNIPSTLDAILISGEIVFAVAFAVLFPNKNRPITLVALMMNLLYLGGSWTFVTYVAPDAAAFVASEIVCFALLGLLWLRPLYLGLSWICIVVWMAVLSAIYNASPLALAIGLLFAIYAKMAATAPARILLLLFGMPESMHIASYCDIHVHSDIDSADPAMSGTHDICNIAEGVRSYLYS